MYIAFSALTLLVGWQEEHPACKNMEWWGAGVVICLERGANDLYMVQLMPLPPRHLLFQQNPEWLIFLVPAYPGSPGKKAIKRLCVCSVCKKTDHIACVLSVCVIYAICCPLCSVHWLCAEVCPSKDQSSSSSHLAGMWSAAAAAILQVCHTVKFYQPRHRNETRAPIANHAQ